MHTSGLPCLASLPLLEPLLLPMPPSLPATTTQLQQPLPNHAALPFCPACPQVLKGALVGGPGGSGAQATSDDVYQDSRQDYAQNEVGC